MKLLGQIWSFLSLKNLWATIFLWPIALYCSESSSTWGTGFSFRVLWHRKEKVFKFIWYLVLRTKCRFAWWAVLKENFMRSKVFVSFMLRIEMRSLILLYKKRKGRFLFSFIKWCWCIPLFIISFWKLHSRKWAWCSCWCFLSMIFLHNFLFLLLRFLRWSIWSWLNVIT